MGEDDESEAGAGAGEGPPAEDDASLDLFWRGRFALLQPRARGYRAGLDPLLLACALPDWLDGEAADLGAGAGALAFASAARRPHLRIRLAESNPIMAGLARRALALPENAAFDGRLSLGEGDILAGRKAREAMGLRDASFDAVLTNPPFHPANGRASPDPLRARAKTVPDAAFLPEWVRVSAALLKHGGLFACVARPEALTALLSGAEGRLGGLEIVPVHPRPARAAIRVLLFGRKGSRAPLSIRPGVSLQDEGERPTPAGLAIAEGSALAVLAPD